MTDPVEKLPFDLIVLIFSLLSTPQLSLLTGVCRDWRTALQLNAILNRVIDLINVKRPLNEEEMMEVLRLLCPLSTHPQNEWLLDITNFWYSFCELASKHSISSEQVMFNKPNGFHSLLSTIAIEKKEKLDKLVLHVGSSRRSTTHNDAFARAIINGLGRLTSMMTGVRELHLQVPSSAISVRSRAPGKGGRACSIRSDLGPSKFKGSWQFSECKVFLEEVIAFTGANITHLGICTSSFDSVEKLYQVLLQFKDSLNHLELDWGSASQLELALELAAQCQNLSSIRLRFFYEKSIGEPRQMGFPSDAPVSHLKKFEFYTEGAYIDFSSSSFLKWLGKNLESFELSFWRDKEVPLQSLDFIFSSNSTLKVIKLDNLKTSEPPDSFIPSSLRFTNLQSLELHLVSGYCLRIFSTAFMPVLGSLIVEDCGGVGMDGDANDQWFSVLQNCHPSLESLEMTRMNDRPSTNSRSSDSNQGLLEFPRLEELSLFVGSEMMTDLCRRFQFSSSRLRTLNIGSRDSDDSDETEESGSILQAIRFLDSSSTTIEAVSLSLSLSHLNFDQELNVQTEMIRTFPKMKSLHLHWDFKQIVDYFSSSSFGNLEVLSLSHSQSESQSYQEECLKRAISIVELNSASLREIEFRSFRKATGYTPQISSFKLPKLKVLCIEVTSPNLVQFFLDHSQGVCLSELTLHALPKSYSLDDLLRVILPMSTSLRRLALRDISFGQDEIESSQEQHQVSSFPILTSLSIIGENLNLLELLGQYQYPLLYEVKASSEGSDNIFKIQTLFENNAPVLSSKKSGFTFWISHKYT